MGLKGGAPPKKAAGTAISVQNGARAVLTEVGERFDPPEHITEPQALEAWDAYWNDPVSSVTTTTDRSLLIRWIDAVNRYWHMTTMADENPIVYSGANGTLAHPYYKVTLALMNQISAMEAQLGIGPRSRNRLGIQIVGLENAKKALEAGGRNRIPASFDNDDDDPRFG